MIHTLGGAGLLLGICAICQLALAFLIPKTRWVKGNPKIYTTCVLNNITYPISYLICFGSYSIYLLTGNAVILYTALCYMAYMFYLFVRQLKALLQLIRDVPVKKENNTPYLLIIIMAWFAIFSMMAIINYLTFIVFPHLYFIPADLSPIENAFEFIYYTFTLMITYSSDTVVATHIVSKSLQIVEILMFYIVVGILISQIIGKLADTVLEPDSKATVSAVGKRK